jgi:hypothetical protein
MAGTDQRFVNGFWGADAFILPGAMHTRGHGRHGLMQCGGERSTSRKPVVLVAAALVVSGGCSSSGSGDAPNIDAPAAAAYAMEHFDANKDGAIEKPELSDNPALAAALPTFDANHDGRLSANEIADGLTQMYASRMNLTGMACTVTRNGRPLVGAKVRLRPIEMLADALPSAEGVTDDSGTAHPAVSAELVPTEFNDKPLMYPGLYRVEITHDQLQLPGRYNAATELGCQVNPVARDGMSVQFDLK